jgi:hypothetical protein
MEVSPSILPNILDKKAIKYLFKCAKKEVEIEELYK